MQLVQRIAQPGQRIVILNRLAEISPCVMISASAEDRFQVARALACTAWEAGEMFSGTDAEVVCPDWQTHGDTVARQGEFTADGNSARVQWVRDELLRESGVGKGSRLFTIGMF